MHHLQARTKVGSLDGDLPGQRLRLQLLRCKLPLSGVHAKPWGERFCVAWRYRNMKQGAISKAAKRGERGAAPFNNRPSHGARPCAGYSGAMQALHPLSQALPDLLPARGISSLWTPFLRSKNKRGERRACAWAYSERPDRFRRGEPLKRCTRWADKRGEAPRRGSQPQRQSRWAGKRDEVPEARKER